LSQEKGKGGRREAVGGTKGVERMMKKEVECFEVNFRAAGGPCTMFPVII
jgi:hypothetical protein